MKTNEFICEKLGYIQQIENRPWASFVKILFRCFICTHKFDFIL